MNNDRRKTIDAIIATMEECQGNISMVGEEEQDYADNIPDNLQATSRCEHANDVACDLDYISQEVEELIQRLREAQE